jgi:D-sedoheptulose 7-phosphate isomerase
MFEKRVQQQFFDAADLFYAASESLSKPTNDACDAILGCITSGGKVLVCGSNASAGTSRQFATSLLGYFDRERPGLAAMYLSSESALPFAKQIQALGQPGDVMMAFDPSGQSTAVLDAIDAAHAKEMAVIVLTGKSGGTLAQSLLETDVWICVPHEKQSRIIEVHTLISHCLCDAIDMQLLGEQENT